MELIVNGEVRQVDDEATVADLVVATGAPARGSAVAIDGVVVPKSRWHERQLAPGERVELVQAVQGG